MQLRLTYFFLLLTVTIVGGCANPVPVPVPVPKSNPLDILMQAHGYWDWKQNSSSYSRAITPADLGYTRQLVFRSDGHVAISHDLQLFMQPTYQLSTQVPAYCSNQSPIAMVEYSGEAGNVGNNNLRFYNIFISPTDTTLTLIGEQTCIRGGTNEYYRWHQLP